MDAIDELLTRGVSEVLPSKEGLASLMRQKGQITLYQGFDPSTDKLHIGHLVGIRKLAQFQKEHHKVIFLIGDFTGRIGDPTDKSAARKKLTKKEVTENAKGYKEQIKNVLNFDGKNPAEIRYNSEWLGKLSLEDALELAGHFTVQQMLERDFFKKRIEQNKAIYLPEFLYPVMQGYDSVHLGIDLEIGATDQLFNMMAGRTLIKAIKGQEKYVLTLKLLEDPTGKKMGKTEGNAINLSDTPVNIYREVLKLPDSFIPGMLESLTDLSMETLKDTNIQEVKTNIAFEVVKQLFGTKSAVEAKKDTESRYKAVVSTTAKGDVSLTLNKFNSFRSLGSLISTASGYPGPLVFRSMNSGSVSEAKNLISQGAVKLIRSTAGTASQETITNNVQPSSLKAEPGTVIKVGENFIEVKK